MTPEQIQAVLKDLRNNYSRKSAEQLRRELDGLQVVGQAARKLTDKGCLSDTRTLFDLVKRRLGDLQGQEKRDLAAQHRSEQRDLDKRHQLPNRSF